MTIDNAFTEVAAVADAVLFEGYLLYPYRASAQKNRIRWQWGVLAPRGYGEQSGEVWSSRTECLLEPRGDDARVHLRVRFLQLQQRTVLDALGREVEELKLAGTRHLSWEEGLPRHVDAVLPVAELLAGATVPIRVPGSWTGEDLAHPDGTPGGRLLRTCWPLVGTVTLHAEDLPGPYGVLRLRVEVHNDAGCPSGSSRAEALRTSLIGTHSLLAVEPGSFLSLTDPPQWAAPYAAACESLHTWPVLAGPAERSDLLLSAPIILADHPQLAPESTVELFDGTENDELLTLRTLALTDAEKAEARATDPRAAAIVDAVEALPPEILERLHGAIRSMDPVSAGSRFGADSPMALPRTVPWWDPGADASVDPETDTVLVGDVPVAKGSSVVLRPGRGCDAQDAFLAGMRATVQAVVHDVDGTVHVAVSLDDDPAADLQTTHGRFRYFRPEELEVTG
ncbi:hypothetical protein [Pseudonocardia asaccharolytica]|uniref:Uncharacterized protein n=1 Tax=Pseudonocardia asaccharolytica DSM 44247 = NBRC 16224 TaxID=1123024 RepID=A0A511DB69_9PSEU|nr:hypothetical protein [Pseudonocardia asaccharolytica]GEL20904.1 hypothetical protein PA7_47410 [Pseudonocardia asaccharolytica DSM 44247 = NBRC 16224]